MKRKTIALFLSLLLSFSLVFSGGEASAEAAPEEIITTAGYEAEGNSARETDSGLTPFPGKQAPNYQWFINDSALVYGGWSSRVPEKELMGEDYKGLFVYRLEGDVYCFAELQQDEEVMSFLILGKERALMWDSGLGIFNTRALAEKITDLPITLLNSHEHPDHIGGNYRFDEILCYNAESAIRQLTEGIGHEKLISVIAYNTYIGEWPEGYDSATVYIPGKAPTGVVEDGQIIDLGGRTLEVMYTPGHTDASIMLIDEANHILFTGDMFYPGPIYVVFPNSSLKDYTASMRKATDRAEELGLTHIYCSHNALVEGLEEMKGFTAFCEDVLAGKVKGTPASHRNILLTAYEYRNDLDLFLTDFAAAR